MSRPKSSLAPFVTPEASSAPSKPKIYVRLALERGHRCKLSADRRSLVDNICPSAADIERALLLSIFIFISALASFVSLLI